jgi:hypothetical protein
MSGKEASVEAARILGHSMLVSCWNKAIPTVMGYLFQWGHRAEVVQVAPPGNRGVHHVRHVARGHRSQEFLLTILAHSRSPFPGNLFPQHQVKVSTRQLLRPRRAPSIGNRTGASNSSGRTKGR